MAQVEEQRNRLTFCLLFDPKYGNIRPDGSKELGGYDQAKNIYFALLLVYFASENGGGYRT